ncbi:MAG: hypothetical protein ACRDMV_01420 [Streptosporangiales bacterium]
MWLQAVRVLNYATFDAADGIGSPGVAVRLLHTLNVGARALTQTPPQLARWLDQEQRGGRFATTTGEDPAAAVADVSAALTEASYHAQALHQALERAERRLDQVRAVEPEPDGR